MGREPRSWEPKGLYHVIPKGNDGREIVWDETDRDELLGRGAVVMGKYEARVLGYCLMTTHVHFLVRCGEPGLSKPIQEWLCGYSRWWNRRHGCEGHVFINRCHVEDVETDRHLAAVARYIDLNPVRAELVERPEQWRWSSYRAHVGLEPPPWFLANDEFLSFFGRTPPLARQAYRQFVEDWLRTEHRAA